MSEPILPLRQWPAGIQQASVPANDNALRLEALSRPCLGVANDESGTDMDGDVWLVGDTPAGAFASFDENDIALFQNAGWYAWAPVDGLRLVVNDVRKVFNGTAWIDDPSGGGGSGDVSGPASSVDSHVALFDGTTGKLLKDGGALGGMAGINDAPSDGTTYGRKDGAWAATAGSGDFSGPASSVDGNIVVFDGTTGKLGKDGGAPASRSPNIQSVASASTVTPTFSNDMVRITAQAAALTLADPTGTAIPGLGMVIRIKDNGTARSIAYGSQYRAIGVTLPTTTVAGKTLYLAMIYNDTDTRWDVIAVGTQA